MNNNDISQNFIFENAPIRGEFVRLKDSFQTIMQQHRYPLVICQILGEMLVVVSLLAASIKFKGKITTLSSLTTGARIVGVGELNDQGVLIAKLIHVIPGLGKGINKISTPSATLIPTLTATPTATLTSTPSATPVPVL